MKKRIFALLLAMCMVFGITSVALADENVAVDLNYMGSAMEVTIPAGESVSYFQYRVGGMELTVTGEDAYIIYNGQREDAFDRTNITNGSK